MAHNRIAEKNGTGMIFSLLVQST